MGKVFSSLGYCALEGFIALSSGAVGISYLVFKGLQQNYFRNLSAAGLTFISLLFIFQNEEVEIAEKEKVICITGCDSGLGFSMALHLYEQGFTVIAGFLNLNSDGAKELRKICGNSAKYLHIDLTEKRSIEIAVQSIEQFLNENKNYKLWALINNSGVMVFAEFEWQTERLIRQQIEVNFIGTLNLTKIFCPLLRKHKGRIINITSHCSQACLPGLAVYGATKAALSSWNDGIRIELGKYGIKVINFIPGSFVTQSNIMAYHRQNCNEMYENLSKEQQIFYKEYFQNYTMYLMQLSEPKLPRKIDDSKLYETLEKSLLHVYPRAKYVNEPLNYKFYHALFKYSSTYLRDKLILQFMKVPSFSDRNEIKKQ